MTIPLSTLLARTDLGLSRLAGPADDRPIAMVGISELDDPARYLLGGELLLTAGVHFPQTEAGIDAYVSRLASAGTAALGFGVTPVYAEVPEALAECCARHGLPLLRVPPQTSFVAISRAFQNALAEARSRDLRRVSEAQAALASAASRPDAVESVLRQLASRLGAWTVLIDSHDQELFSAGTRPSAPARERLRALASRTRARTRSGGGSAPAPTSATEHHPDGQLVVHTLPGPNAPALGIATRAGAGFTSVDRSVTGLGVVLLSLLTGPRHALGGDSRSASALVRLLLGGAPEEAAALLQPEADPPRWTVVRGRRTHRARSATAAPVHLAALGTALATPFLDLDERADRLHALIPEAAEPADSDVPRRLGWTLGFSAPARTGSLATADAQAERALRQALATGEPVVRHRPERPGVGTLVDREQAAALARERFAPLAEAGPPGPEALLETLRTWLSLHGSWDRTAAALSLHRNTVRQRVDRVGRLLGVDLSDADERMELWFALRWL